MTNVGKWVVVYTVGSVHKDTERSKLKVIGSTMHDAVRNATAFIQATLEDHYNVNILAIVRDSEFIQSQKWMHGDE